MIEPFNLSLEDIKNAITGYDPAKQEWYVHIKDITFVYNYSLMDSFVNNKRGEKPIKQFIDLESLVEYINVMLNVKTMDLDGVEYLKGWLPTLLKALKEGK